MTSTLRPPGNPYFLTEAQDLLSTIEQGLFSLRSERTTAKVHELMRAAHTLKGAAASVELSAVANVAHILEDIFRAFYNPDVEIDAEVEALLFQGYECLRLLLTAQFDGSQVDESGILNRAADIIARLQAKLGDCFNQEAPIPSSAELGFDMVQSMFEIGVTQRLQELSQAIVSHVPNLDEVLRSETEIFLGLAESVELPGFAAIARTTLAALERNPEAVQMIAEVALRDFEQGQAQILAGDRKQGGAPSPQLQQFANGPITQPAAATLREMAAQPDAALIDWAQVASATPDPPLPTATRLNALIASFVVLLQTEIPLDHWLQDVATRLKSSIKLRVSADATPAFQSNDLPGDSASESDHSASVLPPALSLNALLSNFASESAEEDEPSTIANPDFIDDLLASASDPVNTAAEAIGTEMNQTGNDRKMAAPSTPSEVISFKSTQSSPADAVAANLLTTSASVRVELEKLEKLNYLTGELIIHQNQQTSREDTFRVMVQELLDRLQKHQQTIDELCSQGDRLFLSHQSNNGKHTEKTSSIVQQFDELEMDRYSEIHVLARSTLHEVMELKSISDALDQTIRQFRRARDSQQRLLLMIGNDLTAIRMQPLEPLFQRLTQVVQQLSTSHNKPVQISVSGTQVLVDKTIVEKLYDPLLHLVRNAFDHGLEPAEMRQATGKPAVGRIEINAYHQGHRTVIEVKDDGPGIDLQRVAQRAIETGLLTEAASATVAENTLLSYLFEPGFSTATQVSDLSGRGVGLDVVRSQVESFKGTVGVSFTPQQGSTFSLQIPLSLTIAKLLVCRDQDICYALPIDMIEQIVSQPEALSLVGQQQVMQWRQGNEETTVVVRSLSELVHASESQSSKEQQSEVSPTRSVILVRTETGFMGIAVEQVLGEQELVIRPFGRAIVPPPFAYGCCIISSNQLALVLDVRMLLQQPNSSTFVHQSEKASTQIRSGSVSDAFAEIAALEASTFSDPPVNSSLQYSHQHYHILVIEDSLTLRRTLSQLLQQVGYQVSQAKDGLEGLAFLQKHPGVDLILCDIEMPRMNGFEFLSQRHQHPALTKIPVIMLTSRSRVKYRQFALELGAADFMTKPYVDQTLLSTIHHFLAERQL